MIICLTGIDGCGKGTQVDLLMKYLRSKNCPVFSSKAYGQAEQEYFAALLDYWDPVAILFLFQALHVQQRIETTRAIARGEIVIADRWDESYLVYHSNYGLLASDPELCHRLNKIAFDNIRPDITFLLQISIEEAKKRCLIRGEDFFDRLSREYHETMLKGYLKLAEERGWIIIDAEQPTLQIHKQILSLLPFLSIG